MNRREDEKWLDELISRVINTQKPQFDAEAWKEKHAKEVRILESLAEQSRQTRIWPIIYQSPIRKLAAAAVILGIVALSITFLSKSPVPTYAIEQTIEASHAVRQLYFEYYGRTEDEPLKQCWVEFDDSGQPTKVRVSLHKYWGDREVVQVWKDGKTQQWLKQANTLCIFDSKKHTAKILKLVRDCDPKTAVESLYERHLKGEVQIKIDQPSDKTKPIVIKGTFEPGKYLLDNPTLPSFRDVLFVNRQTKLVTAIEVYELKNSKYEYNGVWRYHGYDQPFDSDIFSLKNELPLDVVRIDYRSIIQVAKSPADMQTILSLNIAYRRGGIEAVYRQCEKAIEMLGPQPAKVTVKELLAEFNGT